MSALVIKPDLVEGWLLMYVPEKEKEPAHVAAEGTGESKRSDVCAQLSSHGLMASDDYGHMVTVPRAVVEAMFEMWDLYQEVGPVYRCPGPCMSQLTGRQFVVRSESEYDEPAPECPVCGRRTRRMAGRREPLRLHVRA
jgi:hypothetical protein